MLGNFQPGERPLWALKENINQCPKLRLISLSYPKQKDISEPDRLVLILKNWQFALKIMELDSWRMKGCTRRKTWATTLDIGDHPLLDCFFPQASFLKLFPLYKNISESKSLSDLTFTLVLNPLSCSFFSPHVISLQCFVLFGPHYDFPQ